MVNTLHTSGLPGSLRVTRAGSVAAGLSFSQIAATDPARVTRKDPGNPDVCNVFTIHQGFSPPDVQAEVALKCRTAGWGCLDCKRVLADHMIATLTPVRERAAELRASPGGVRATLRAGAERARAIARRTMHAVRQRMGFLEAAGE